jgi:tetratricopeptide (TPR) repeat protein
MLSLLFPLLVASAHAADRADVLADKASAAYQARNRTRAHRLAEKSLALRENAGALEILVLVELEELNAPLPPKARRSEEAARAAQAERVKALDDTCQRLERIEPDAVALGIVRTVMTVGAEGDLLAVQQPDCPPEARASFDAAEAAFAAGNLAKAKEAYDAALDGCPKNSLWWTYSGDAFHSMGNETGAVARYERALEIDPCNHVAHRFAADVMIGMPNLGKTDIDKLSGHAIDAVVCNPHYEAGWSTLGQIAKGTSRGNDLRLVDPQGYQLLVSSTKDGDGDALDRRVDAAKTILAAGPPDTTLWKLLALAQKADMLTEAVAFETLDAQIADAYRARRVAMKDGLRAWVVVTRVPTEQK